MRINSTPDVADRIRVCAKGTVAAMSDEAVNAKPKGRRAFEVWLSAYRNQLEEFAGSQNRHQTSEQPNPKPAEAVPDHG